MRLQVLLVFIFLCSFSIVAQNKEFDLDYTATYVVSKSSDTISIAVGNEGRFIYTDSPILAKSMGRSFSKILPPDTNESVDVGLLMDFKEKNMTMFISNQGMKVMGTFNFSMLFPKSLDKEEATSLQSFKTERSILVNGKKYSIHSISPDNEPSDKMFLAFDPKHPLDYNTHFGPLFSGIFGKEFAINIPDGIIVYAEKNEKELLRLVNIESTNSKGSINFEMSLTEK